jgi:GTP cyclohydrolase IA
VDVREADRSKTSFGVRSRRMDQQARVGDRNSRRPQSQGIGSVDELLTPPADQPEFISVRRSKREIDRPAVEAAAAALLSGLGVDLDADGVRDTPRRVANAYCELLSPAPFVATTFENESGYDELVVATNISFQSLCEHHLLPFHGVAHVAYLPEHALLGISKLARVVDYFARDLQIQERLTNQIADWLEETLQPRGVGVVIEAEHTCMTIRGVGKPGSRTVTSDLRGVLRDDARTRQEFMTLTNRPRAVG